MKKFLILLPFLSFPSLADWLVQTDNSVISFVSTKQSHVREVHQIQSFTLSVQDDNKVSIKLDLSSVESGIPIRNDRMREMLFDVSNFRYATLSFVLPESLDSINSTARYSISALLELKGQQAPVQLDMLISPGEDQVTATLLKPVIVSAQQFGLEQGIDALRKIAGLTSIGYSVPVNATIILKKS